MLRFMLPGSTGGMLDSVVFGIETEYSGILCKVDDLYELGTAKDGLLNQVRTVNAAFVLASA